MTMNFDLLTQTDGWIHYTTAAPIMFACSLDSFLRFILSHFASRSRMCIEVMVALCAPPCRFLLILYDFAGLLMPVLGGMSILNVVFS